MRAGCQHLMPAVAQRPAMKALKAVCRLQVSALASPGTSPVQKGKIPLPESLIICPWGESRDLEGNPVIVNETTVAELAANQSLHGFDEVAMDWNHNTTPKFDADGNPIPVKEPQPVAGYGTLSVIPGKGIVYTPLSWTPEGETFYTGRHYRDLSPTVAKNEKGEVTFVHSVALTRNGQVGNLHAFSALSSLTPTINTTMESTLDFRALLAALLGLAATASDEEIVAAASAKKEAPELDDLGAEKAKAAKPEEVTALSARLDNMERDQIVRAATAEGKVIPLSADQINLTPIPVLKALAAGITPTVTLGGAEKRQVLEQPGQLKALSVEEKEVCRQLGIKEEDFQKA